MCTNFFLSGKQDYKKTKSALKATRLKAEAKKNSSGFRVRLAWAYFLLTFHTSPTISACLSCLPICDSARLSVCQPSSFHSSVCLPARLRACLTRSLFLFQTLSSVTAYCRSFKNVNMSISLKWCDVTPLLVLWSVEILRGVKLTTIFRVYKKSNTAS